ncbi:hypothetical protein RRG08_020302 [Elysia crispata]|uniref:Uncharacterized protein n=1 Tax=Elysia crispata TaxID=231223 RepID=A0AAE1EAY1_9GAST|nr:hypothetical protein RRG08_020302 [Elysia crispata]
MGNLCDCFKSADGPTPKTPLLSEAQPPAVRTQPVKDGQATAPSVGQSARRHKPEEAENEFITSGHLKLSSSISSTSDQVVNLSQIVLPLCRILDKISSNIMKEASPSVAKKKIIAVVTGLHTLVADFRSRSDHLGSVTSRHWLRCRELWLRLNSPDRQDRPVDISWSPNTTALTPLSFVFAESRLVQHVQVKQGV